MLTAMSSPDYAMLTDDDLVTGEAVALDLPAATVFARLASGLLDVAATLVLGFVLVFLAVVVSAHADAALQGVAVICWLVVTFLVYPTVVETMTRGRSPGKLAFGLRVVRDDGGTVTGQQSFVRALIGIVEIYVLLGGPAVISSMVSSKGKRIGDHAAGTYVVRDRAQLTLPPPTPMPHALRAWAASADVRTPPVELVLAARAYLSRLPSLDPATRQRLGDTLATRLTPYVAPPPPAGTTSWDFLAAVLASRRDRDLARLHRDESLRSRLLHGRH
jgi:uncharacterized RDD family membrane protein YckC